MEYINKKTLEVYKTIGEVRKALSPIALPKILTKAVLEENGLDYLYDLNIPKTSSFERAVRGEPALVGDKYQYTYTVELAFPEETHEKLASTLLKQAKETKINELKRQLEDETNKMTSTVAECEKLSWSKQEAEATAYKLDATTPTPYIDALLSTRNKNETKEDLVQTILAKAAGYATAHGALLGKYHAKLKEVEEFTATAANLDEKLEELSGVRIEFTSDEEA